MEIIGNGHLAKTVREGLAGVEGNYTIIGIDTPISDDYTVDLTSIYDAVEAQKGNDSLVIIMSPIPVGTSRKLQEILGRPLVYNPENLRLARGSELYTNADRQIIGCNSSLREQMSEFYKWFKNPLLFMSLEEAEMVKHATNAYLTISIRFANDIEKICKKVGADYGLVSMGLSYDSRIGFTAYLNPGEPSKHLLRDVAILQSL